MNYSISGILCESAELDNALLEALLEEKEIDLDTSKYNTKDDVNDVPTRSSESVIKNIQKFIKSIYEKIMNKVSFIIKKVFYEVSGVNNKLETINNFDFSKLNIEDEFMRVQIIKSINKSNILRPYWYKEFDIYAISKYCFSREFISDLRERKEIATAGEANNQDAIDMVFTKCIEKHVPYAMKLVKNVPKTTNYIINSFKADPVSNFEEFKNLMKDVKDSINDHTMEKLKLALDKLSKEIKTKYKEALYKLKNTEHLSAEEKTKITKYTKASYVTSLYYINQYNILWKFQLSKLSEFIKSIYIMINREKKEDK